MYGNLNLSHSKFFNNTANDDEGIFCDYSEFSMAYNNFNKNNVYSAVNTNEDFINNTYIRCELYKLDYFNTNFERPNYLQMIYNSYNGTLPSKYDLRDYGLVSSVKNQGSDGNCWAFAGIAALESCILKATGIEYDFSEENMKNLMAVYSDYGWNMPTNNGGYKDMVLGYFSSWMGPINDSDDKYVINTVLSPLMESIMHVQNIVYPPRLSYTDNDGIKNAILNYGAVFTGIYYNNAYYKNTNYYNYATEGNNHAIVIVGWDDNYSKNNFRKTPPGNGAWICKNSWGENYGDKGYFYVSYYDIGCARLGLLDASFTFILNDTVKYDKNYQYDVIGITDYLLTNQSNIWYQNTFNASSDEIITAFSTYFNNDLNFTVEIYVNDELKLTQKGSSHAGYFTINLDDFIPVYKNDLFKVLIKLTGVNEAWVPISEKISAIRTHYYPNISFISYDGVNWIDLYDYVLNLSERGHNYNSAVACIKTFTIFNLTTTTVLNEVSRDKNNVNLTATVKDQYGHLINEGYVIFEYGGEKYNRSLLNGIANLSIKNLNDNITIRATYENNSHYLSSNDELRVFVQKYDVNLTMNIGNIYYGEYFKVNTSLTGIFGDLIDSYLVLTIGNKSYNISSNHVFIVPDLFDPSNYDVSIYYKGSNRYNESESNLNMTVNKNDVNLDVTANDITYGEYLTFYVSLSSNSKLINENVILNINGKNYTFTANNKFILPIILEASSYNFHIYYCGNKIYNPNNIIKMVNVSKINPKLEFKIKDVKYGQDIIAEVKLTGINDLLLNENVILTLNNKNYTFKANNNHVLPIKLNASIYNAIVFFEGDNNYNNDYSIISFVVDKSEVELSLAIQNITYGDNLIINNNINHDVIVKINSKTFSIKENSIYQIPDLFDAGNYQGIVIFEGDNNYKNNTQIINFSIHKFTPELKLNFSDINYGKHILADAGLIGINKSLLYESLRLTINNENFNFKSNDKFYIPILLNASNYIVNVIYNGNTNYNSISDKINVNVNKINPKLIFNISDTCYGSDLVITNYLTGINQELINESLILSINNKEYKVNSNNIYILPDILDVGQYSAFITFNGNNNYNKIKSEVSFNVNLKNVDMNLTVNKNLNNVSISVKLSDSINDTINVRINNQNYDIKNGDILNLNNLNLGQYWVEVLFNKTGYKTLFIKDNFTVDSINTLINVNNIVMYYRDGTRLTGVLTDSNANILSNKSISILINGVKYTRNTDDKGVFSLNLGLNPNLYTTTLKFMGDSNYINSSKEIMVDIKSTIDSNGLIKYYKNASQFHATILDYAGNLVINTEIVMNINGVFYKRVTDSRGVVSLNINLYPGNYILTLYNPITDETRGLNITVLSIIVDNHDLVKYYRNASRYSVKLLDGKGSLLSDAHIIFNINGIFYERQTDSDGIASLAINLEPNTYIITAYYGDLAISNSIEVLSTIKSNDIVMRYKDGTQFNVTILDGVGKQYSNQKVIFNINGVFYTRITDSNGIAALNINLQAGKYIITSSYNGLNVGNTVTIKNINIFVIPILKKSFINFIKYYF